MSPFQIFKPLCAVFRFSFSLPVLSGTPSCHYSSRSTLRSFTAPSTTADESQDYWSQTPHRSAADAADVSNPCLDLIVGPAGLLERNIFFQKMTPNIPNWIKIKLCSLQKAVSPGCFYLWHRQK